MSYLHGVETITADLPGGSFTIVATGVIGLIGISPTGPINTPVLVTKQSDFAQFGSPLPGFSIPQSLEVFALQGAATAIVINVFDPAVHTAQVTAEAHTVTGGKLKLGFAPIGAVTVLDSTGGATTFVKGTDYSLDVYGNFATIGSTIAEATVLKFTYKKLDLSTITSSVIIGAQDSGTGARTGSRCWELAYNLFGFNPKIFVAPLFSTLTPVGAQLTSLATKYRGIAYIDAPAGTIVSGAVAGRGPSGTIGFNISDSRTELVYPELKKYDTATNTNVNFPYSAFLAAIRQVVDNVFGFWVSSSNQAINCQGIELPISAGLNDTGSDTNTLNAAGITTIFNTFGTGIRTWGNRNSTYPAVTGPKTFTSFIRLDDIVSERMEQAALPYVDQPITQAFIDVIREEGNSGIRALIQLGALLPGSKVIYSADDNTPQELANGHIVFERVYMGSTPAERITIKSVMDITLLNSLK